MLYPRIIPVLLVQNNGLVKTVNFKDGKYIGDPLNAVKIFNEKKADEIIVLDIDATKNNKRPNLDLIQNIASECRMPLCYGGGIKSVEEIEKIISLGVEKVALSSIVIEDRNIITKACEIVGSQSICVVLDVKKNINNKYEIFINNGQHKTIFLLEDFLHAILNSGFGELVINSIDNDGTMLGYDLNLVDLVFKIVNTPVTIIGGAKSHEDLSALIKKYKTIGLGVGSLFVFKGKYKAVLINYPSNEEKKSIFNHLKN